ncbi:hypothetical protein LINPERHAP2_LOCUS41035, partial [Linum perenne]
MARSKGPEKGHAETPRSSKRLKELNSPEKTNVEHVELRTVKKAKTVSAPESDDDFEVPLIRKGKKVVSKGTGKDTRSTSQLPSTDPPQVEPLEKSPEMRASNK